VDDGGAMNGALRLSMVPEKEADVVSSGGLVPAAAPPRPDATATPNGFAR